MINCCPPTRELIPLQVVRTSFFRSHTSFSALPFPITTSSYVSFTCLHVFDQNWLAEVCINGVDTDATLISCRSKWRPTMAIIKKQLEALLKLKIPLSEISSALHVSRPTVYRAIRDYNIDYKRFSRFVR